MNGRGIILALLCLLCLGEADAQQYAYRVSFTDKNNTPYSLTNPSAYLSQRAIDRRNAQGIAVDSTDLPVSDVYLQGVLAASSGVLHTRSRWFNYIVILVSNPSDITAVQALPYVSGVLDIATYPIGLHNKHAQSGNNKNEGVMQAAHSVFAKSSGSAAYYGATWPQTTMVNGDYLHDQGFKGEGMLIAVLDDGFSCVPTHPGFDSLRNEGRIIETHNFVLDTNYIYNISSNHGGSVLSTMVGNTAGTYVGSAPHAEYALYITENLTSEMPVEMYQVVAATERADSLGADVITISSGYNTFTAPYSNLNSTDLNGSSTVAAKAANLATQKGILFVATAGNDGSAGLLTPGDADSALTVGAVQPDGSAWSSSGYGPNGAGRIKPDVATLGAPANVFTFTGYGTASGTSFSTPQIAGWAACLLQATPGATPRMIRAAIDSSAHIHTAPEIQRGYGIPNFHVAADILNVPVIIKGLESWVAVAPNPCNGYIGLWTNLGLSDKVAYTLTDISGRVLIKNSLKVDSGIHNTQIVLPLNTPTGMYFLKVASGANDATIKVINNN